MGSGWAFAVPGLVAEFQKSARFQFHRIYIYIYIYNIIPRSLTRTHSSTEGACGGLRCQGLRPE